TLLLALSIGLGLLPPLLLVLRLAHAPLRWWLVLGIAAAGPLALAIRGATARRTRPPPAPPAPKPAPKSRAPRRSRPPRAPAVVIAALAAAWLAGMLYAGAARNPWLEDDDSWQHAVGAHYVAHFATTAQPWPPISHYLEPYPPYFTALMGVLHQSQPDLQW